MIAKLLNAQITAAISLAATGGKLQLNDAARSICAQANFTYGSGGATVDAYLQTSVDGGNTWIDIAQFHFTTASARVAFNLSSLTPVTTEYTVTDGALTANTAKDGLLGPLFQVKLASTGTYAGTTLAIDVAAQER
ncbi:MAG TPA: hypothetical protein VHW95_00030 [Steroidobacteraceae bacterium]|jgi:hypothetical protein|nr:hypothetical protein [Steroidobacteraceae bacterium]